MQAPTGKNSSLPDWPEPVLCETFKAKLLLSKLTGHEKSALWADLKTNNPTKAKALCVLARDPVILELIAQFDASIALDRTDLSQVMYDKMKHHFE